jgi:hypothetical protein
MDAELIDPTRDRVWAVEVTVTYTTYVVVKDASEAERIGEDKVDEDEDLRENAVTRYLASELTKPLDLHEEDDDLVPWGRSRWEHRELTVNEAVDLVASHKPVYDTEVVLIPFVDSPPPIYPRRGEGDAAGRRSQ